MGQKSNINSLRLLNQTNLSNNNIKLNFVEITIVKYLRFLLKKKGIYIVKTTSGFINNRIHIFFYVFYNTQKIIRYKKYQQIKCKFFKHNINSLFKKILKIFKKSILEIRIININKKVDKQIARKIFIIYKKYVNTLFEKKFYLCIDITKISVLFLLNKIDNENFLEQIGKVFSGIHKKNHLRYFKLISTLFKFLTNNTQISGLKLLISGKLLGKAIASQRVITVGCMPTQTLNKNIDFKKIHVYTGYGVFGFKLWTHRNNI